MAILSEQRKTNKFESHNSLKLNFTNIWGLLSNFAECEYLLESRSSDKLGWLNWFRQFLFGGLFYFSLKGFCYSYAWSCSLCERASSFCTRGISRKLCRFLLIFDWLYFTLCLTSFSTVDHLLHFYTRFLMFFQLT